MENSMNKILLVMIAVALTSCGDIQIGNPNIASYNPDLGVWICYGADAVVQTCETQEAHLCNSGSTSVRVKVTAKRGITDDPKPVSYQVAAGATSKTGPLVGYAEYMDSYCRNIYYSVAKDGN
jgi:hypothetical protein